MNLYECCDAFGQADRIPAFVLVGIFETLLRITNSASVLHEGLGGRSNLFKGRFVLGAILREVDQIVDGPKTGVAGYEVAFEIFFGALLGVVTGHRRNRVFRVHGTVGHLQVLVSLFEPVFGRGRACIQYNFRFESRVIKGVWIVTLFGESCGRCDEHVNGQYELLGYGGADGIEVLGPVVQGVQDDEQVYVAVGAGVAAGVAAEKDDMHGIEAFGYQLGDGLDGRSVNGGFFELHSAFFGVSIETLLGKGAKSLAVL